MNHIEGLPETYVQVKAHRGGSSVHRDLSHIHVHRIGAKIEIAKTVESGVRMVEVGIHVTVEEEAEIDSSLRKRALCRGRRSGSRRLRGYRLSCCRRLRRGLI